MRVRSRATSLRISAPQAWPAPRELSTVIRAVISFAFSGFHPSFIRMLERSCSNVCASGYFLEVMAVSSSSGIPPPARKPLYQISNGSSSRPSREEIKAATFFTCEEESNSLKSSSTSFCVTSMVPSNARMSCVG